MKATDPQGQRGPNPRPTGAFQPDRMANRGKGSSGGEQHQCHLPPEPQARMLCGLWGKGAQGSSANLGKVQCDLGKSVTRSLCASEFRCL